MKRKSIGKQYIFPLSELRPACGYFDDKSKIWVYQPAPLIPFKKAKDASEIAGMIDNRSLPDLWIEATQSSAPPHIQLEARARCGDDAALELFVRLVRGLVESLSDLAHDFPQRMESLAPKFSHWPLLLSLNPQDMKRAKEVLRVLKVGTDATIKTNEKQRLNPANFWTRLAQSAYTACREAITTAGQLQVHAKLAVKRRRQLVKYGGTKSYRKIYELSDGQHIVFEEWHERCARLCMPITAESFPNWWKAVSLCVLHYWQIAERLPDEPNTLNYNAALKQVGIKDEEPWRRRDRVMQNLRQALKSLIDLQ